MPAEPTRGKMTLMRQTCELIPAHMVSKLAREHEIDARKLSAWSHVTAHLYGQLTHAVSLNDICDGLELNSTGLRAIRGATPPRRNTFSNANRTRAPAMACALYWRMVDHLTTTDPSFGLAERTDKQPGIPGTQQSPEPYRLQPAGAAANVR